MRERTWKARRHKLLTEEANQPEGWWWLSFADDDGFLGAVLTQAKGFINAVQKTHDLGINPGGEVKAVQLPDNIAAHPKFATHEQYADQLLTKKDIDNKLGGAAKWPENS